mgnify:FL=1
MNKNFRYDSVIFDLDGTLLNTLDDLHDAVVHSLAAYGLPARTLDEVRRFVGNGIRLLIERSVPEGCPNDITNSVFEEFKKYYGIHCNDKTKPYDGIPELLRQLKSCDIPCAIVSNKADFAVKTLARDYFDGLCAVAIGERDGIRKKPAPDSVFEAMALLDAKKPVYVGDSEVDIATAKAAGIPCISVSWGFRGKNELISAGAEVICESTAELLSALEA